MKARTFLAGFAMAAMLVGTDVASAQTGNNKATSQTDEINATLETVEVIAKAKGGSAEAGYVVEETKNLGPLGDRKLLDTPYTVNIADEDFMKNIQARSIGEVFNRLPGVNINAGQSDHNFYHGVNLRGFSDLSSSTQFNGVPTGNHSNIGAFVEEMESVEVVSGLSGFMYGAGNVGSAINYNFKRPLYDFTNRITVGNYGNQLYYAHADLGGPIANGKLAYRLNVLTQNGEGVVKPQELERNLVSGALDWNVTDDLQLQFMASHGKIKLDGKQAGFFIQGEDNTNAFPSTATSGTFNNPPNKLYSIPDPPTGQLLVPSDTWWDVDRTDLGVGLKYKITDKLKLRAAAHYNDATFGGTSANLVFTEDPDIYLFGASYGGQAFKSRGAYTYLDAEFDTGPLEHKLTLGASGYFLDRESTSGNGRGTQSANALYQGRFSNPGLAVNFDLDRFNMTQGAYLLNVSDQLRYNLFIGDSIKYKDKWEVLLGLTRVKMRNRSYATSNTATQQIGQKLSESNDSAITPTVAVMYKPVPSVTTYASYVESVEMGQVVPQNSGGVNWANAGELLPPLKSTQYEVGVKAEVGGMFLTAALFQIDRGLMYIDYPNRLYVQGKGSQLHRGLELTGRGKITKDLTLMGGLTFLDAKVKETEEPSFLDKQPRYAPKFAGKLYAEYALPFVDGLTLTGGVNHFGKVYTNKDNSFQLPSFTTGDLGLKLETETLGQNMTYRLNVTNVTDESYWFSGGSISHLQIGPPRSVAFSAEIQF